MGRAGLAVTAAVIIATPLGLVFGATPSGADVSPATGGWYWAGQPDALPPPVGALPAPVPTPDVPDGDVASGYRPTGVDKQTFLHVANEVGDGATVSSVRLTIKEDSSAVSVSPDAAVIKAKPASGFWLDGAKGAPISQSPAIIESVAIPGKRNASDGTWTFDLTSLAQQWASGTIENNGIGLIPDQSGGTFQVVWKLDTATVDVETGSGDPSDGLNLAAVGGSSSTPTDSSSTGAVGDLSTSTPPLTGDTASSFTPTNDVSSSPTPTAAAPTPPASTAPPQVALGGNTKKAVSKGGLPAGFFIAVLAGIGLLGGVSVALGDLGEPDLPREGSVVRRLERRAAPSN